MVLLPFWFEHQELFSTPTRKCWEHGTLCFFFVTCVKTTKKYKFIQWLIKWVYALYWRGADWQITEWNLTSVSSSAAKTWEKRSSPTRLRQRTVDLPVWQHPAASPGGSVSWYHSAACLQTQEEFCLDGVSGNIHRIQSRIVTACVSQRRRGRKWKQPVAAWKHNFVLFVWTYLQQHLKKYCLKKNYYLFTFSFCALWFPTLYWDSRCFLLHHDVCTW